MWLRSLGRAVRTEGFLSPGAELLPLTESDQKQAETGGESTTERGVPIVA